MIRHNDLVTFSRSLISVAAATAMALSGVTIAQTASAQTTTREWGFLDISDSDTQDGTSLTIHNPSGVELYCTATATDEKYVKPIFAPWVQEGISYAKAQELSWEAGMILERARHRDGVTPTYGNVRFLAPGETKEMPFYPSLKAGSGIFMDCQDEIRGGSYLYAYGVVQSDLSVKSSIPVDDNEYPLPPTTSPGTTTVIATTTVTEPVPTTVTKSVPTTVRQTVVSQPSAATVTQTQTATVTSTLAAPTVTRTVSAEPSDSGSSDSSVIGWIIGIFAALGLGGIAGFLAQNFNIPGLTF